MRFRTLNEGLFDFFKKKKVRIQDVLTTVKKDKNGYFGNIDSDFWKEVDRLSSKDTYYTEQEILDIIRTATQRAAKNDTKNLVNDIHKALSKYPPGAMVTTQDVIKDFEKIDDFFVYTAVNLKRLEMKGQYEKNAITKILVDFVPRYTEAVGKAFMDDALWATKRALEWYGEKVK